MTATKTRSKAPATDTAFCKSCSAEFRFTLRPGQPDPTACHRQACQAHQYWADDEWAQHARFALIRHAAGLPLSKLSLEALHRAGRLEELEERAT